MSAKHSTAHVAALGLGGNVGDPAAAMARALKAIDADPASRVIAVSPLYRTPPWGKTDQADFFNSAALVETGRSPADLLAFCLLLEREEKRVRAERWGPRTLDIDILFYDALVIDEPSLQVPHPRMLERGFVMMPLADIAADKRIAGTIPSRDLKEGLPERRSVGEWLELVDRSGIEIADNNRDWWRRM